MGKVESNRGGSYFRSRAPSAVRSSYCGAGVNGRVSAGIVGELLSPDQGLFIVAGRSSHPECTAAS